jgi:hypothetical protein
VRLARVLLVGGLLAVVAGTIAASAAALTVHGGTLAVFTFPVKIKPPQCDDGHGHSNGKGDTNGKGHDEHGKGKGKGHDKCCPASGGTSGGSASNAGRFGALAPSPTPIAKAASAGTPRAGLTPYAPAALNAEVTSAYEQQSGGGHDGDDHHDDGDCKKQDRDKQDTKGKDGSRFGVLASPTPTVTPASSPATAPSATVTPSPTATAAPAKAGTALAIPKAVPTKAPTPAPQPPAPVKAKGQS